MTTAAGAVEVGDEFVVDVESVAHGGHCVARHEGRVLFVRHTAPGEKVRVRVTEVAKRHARAEAIEVLTPSTDRVEPPCPVAGSCGGCDWQHVSLEAQRRLKTDVVKEALQRFAGLDLPVEVVGAPGDADGLRWRTRLQLAVDDQGRAGLRGHRSNNIVHMQECLLASHPVGDVLAQTWDGSESVEVIDPSVGERVVAPVARQPQRAKGVRGRFRAPRRQRPVNDHLITEAVTVDGETRSFHVATHGFWQVHPAAAETLVRAVMEALEPQPGEKAMDLYSGVGLFARFLADAVGPDGSVLAVESDPRASELGGENLPGQAVSRRGRSDWAAERLVALGERPDVVVLDPPRSGAGERVMRAIVDLAPRKVAYVACDPVALARDLRTAIDGGMVVDSVQAFDLFPMTQHVECVATLHWPGRR